VPREFVPTSMSRPPVRLPHRYRAVNPGTVQVDPPSRWPVCRVRHAPRGTRSERVHAASVRVAAAHRVRTSSRYCAASSMLSRRSSAVVMAEEPFQVVSDTPHVGVKLGLITHAHLKGVFAPVLPRTSSGLDTSPTMTTQCPQRVDFVPQRREVVCVMAEGQDIGVRLGQGEADRAVDIFPRASYHGAPPAHRKLLQAHPPLLTLLLPISRPPCPP